MGPACLLRSSVDLAICDHVRCRLIPPQGEVKTNKPTEPVKELNKKSETYAKEGI